MAAERPGPAIYSIAAHRGFADALVAGLIPRYRDPDLGLARLTLLLPNSRAVRTVTEAFVRQSEGGLLLPRMAVVGDLDLDETLGVLLDPLGAGADIPPAADPVRRWLRLAELLSQVRGDKEASAPARLREAFEIGRTMDRLSVEGIELGDLLTERVAGIVGDVASHWHASVKTFAQVQAHWLADLAQHGELDAPQRRNLLFARASERWKASPPADPIVAAGVTSASPALAQLLRVVSELPQGAVILPDLDLALDDEVWHALGRAGVGEGPDDPPFAPGDAVTHPQYHLKLLLNRMGVARQEVRPWHRSGLAASGTDRSRAISNLFLPPAASARWVSLPADERRLSNVGLMHSANPAEESQAIALLIREALEVPEKRVALITPDRGLAARVVAQLERWGIEADDTAGRPLPQTAAGRVLLLLAEVIATEAAPVPLLALLEHPLVRREGGRAEWLEMARRLDLNLRGPRPAPGLAPLRAIVAAQGKRAHGAALAAWWNEVEAILAPLLALGDSVGLGAALDAMTAAAEALCGASVWGEADGRALAQFIEELRGAADRVEIPLAPADLPFVLRDAMDRVAVRPPWGKHPRVAIYGLLEARMSRAELVICGGLTEGTWPAAPAAEPLLPPAVLRALGVPGGEFRIGLSAHDLAAALGAPEVVLSWAARDEAGPVIPSRFVLRVEAMLGNLAERHRETEVLALARALDDAPPAPPYPVPEPRPTAEQRRVRVSATALDTLRGHPYQFYARAVLCLRVLDGVDVAPDAAWRGNAAHDILHYWFKQAQAAPGTLHGIARAELDRMSAHPLMRSLWRPRLLRALEWIESEVVRLAAEGRTIGDTEVDGSTEIKGVTIHARADRIDRMPGGQLAVVDYKSGAPPSAKRVAAGYALQLGTIGLIAEAGGFEALSGEPAAFEYWSLGASKDSDSGFGYMKTPVLLPGKRSGMPLEEFLPHCRRLLVDALDTWVLGDAPFSAVMAPDFAGFNDFDQLMRLDEWQARALRQAEGEGA